MISFEASSAKSKADDTTAVITDLAEEKVLSDSSPRPYTADSDPSPDCGAKPKQPVDRKIQKIDCEVLRQKFLIEKLEREIQMKSKRGFPSPCLHKLKVQLCCEQNKLKEMMKQAKAECGNETLEDAPCGKRNFKTPSVTSRMSAFEQLEVNESLLSDNESLEADRCLLRDELLNKDRALEDMEEKVDWMQKEVVKLTCENKLMSQKLVKTKSSCCENDALSQLKSVVTNSKKLTCSIHSLETNLSCLREELDCVKKDRKISFQLKCPQESKSCSEVEGNRKDDCESSRPKSNQCEADDCHVATKLKLIQCQYSNLQNEYCRKEKECKETVERMKKCLDSCKGDKERAENEALKQRADEMITEIEDYKVFIKELQEQVDSYREKFLKAQEKVEHQKYLLENLEMSNKDVESQINNEMARIKEKFQEKLAELCPYPKMYEESKVALEESKQKVKGLETDLKATMAALSKSTSELKALKEQPDDSLEMKYKKLQCEVEMLKKKHAGIKATKDCLEDKLTCMKTELENLRKDSTKIITTTKCCAEKNRQILHQHINGLEVDLAQCRASAALSLTEKEEIIKKMKQELAALCGNFNDCQDQIKQLKNQVTYLTNHRHKIRPEDLHKIDYCNPDC